MSGKLDGKVALVTGASTGMGKAAAIEFAKEGAKVVLSARSEDKLKVAAEEIKAAGGEAIIVVGDVSKEADCKKMVDAAVDTFGGLNVAFNNAGIYMAASLAETSDEMATSLLDINLKSHVFCYKYQIPAMSKSGGKGSIIANTSSMGMRVPSAPEMTTSGVYAASKAGADMLMKYAAIEGAPSGVRVNTIAPGHVRTPIYGSMPDEALVGMSAKTQLIGRPGESEEVAKLVLFLASDDAAMITGAVVPIDGGWAIKA